MSSPSTDTKHDKSNGMKVPKLRIYWIRHGESAANKWNIIAGQEDVPLSRTGLQQAQSLGHVSHWKDQRSNWQIYSSDLQRARETIRQALHVAGRKDWVDSLQVDPRLRERSYGAREGFSRTLSEEQAMEVWRLHKVDPPILETDDDVWQRGRSWLLDICSQPLTHVVASSHAGVIREVLVHLIPSHRLLELGASYDPKRKNRLVIPNTSVTILEFDLHAEHPLDTARVVELLNVDHLSHVELHDD